MQFLLKQGGDVNVCDIYEKTPLHEASEKGHKTNVHLLLNMEQILIPVIGLKKLPYIKPGKMDMISPYNLYSIKKQTLIHVTNTEKLLYIKPVKWDMIALCNIY